MGCGIPQSLPRYPVGPFRRRILTKLRLKPTSNNRTSERSGWGFSRTLLGGTSWSPNREGPMPNVAEIIREHVTLDVKCIDRLYVNGYVPRLQSEGGGGGFLRRARARGRPPPAVF